MAYFYIFMEVIMTYDRLDKLIRDLEPQEALLRSHVIPHPDYSVLPTKTQNGKSYLLLENGPSITFCHQPHPFISLHKNSRFTNMPPHIHNGVEISYIYSGKNTMTIGDVSYTLEKRQLLLVDSDIPHSHDSIGQEDDILISVLIEPQFLQNTVFHHLASGDILSDFLSNAISVQGSHTSFILFRSENSRRLPTYMNELMIEHLEPSINSTDVITHLLQLIFLECMSLLPTKHSYISNIPGSSCSNANMIPILNYISNHYQDCTLTSLAEHFGIHPAYLTTLLKKATGLSFRELVQKQRFSSALSLLENTTMPVEEIALAVGYDTTTYFYKKFRAFYGCSPKEYRMKSVRELSH